MTDNYICPNKSCRNDKTSKQPSQCPDCGTETKPCEVKDLLSLFKEKKHNKNADERMEKHVGSLLATDQMSDADLKKLILEDMLNLAMHESGTGWMRLGTLLTMNSTDQMLGAGFKALIDQNKIIIRQNELILRALRQQPPPP